MKNLLAMIIVIVALIGNTFGETIVKVYDPITGVETNKGVAIKFNFVKNNRIVRNALNEINSTIPSFFPFRNDLELKNNLAKQITDMGFNIYQSGGVDGDNIFAEIAPSNLHFESYNEFLEYSRNTIRELANLALATFSTNEVYNPDKPIMLGFGAVYLEEFGDFRYWLNFFRFTSFPIEKIDGVMRISESFVASLEPEIAPYPFFRLGFGIEKAFFFSGPTDNLRLTHNTFIDPGQDRPIWLPYQKDGVYIERRYLLNGRDDGKDWFAVVFIDDGRSFVLKSSGLTVECSPQISVIPSLGEMEVFIGNGAPGSTVEVEISTNLVSWVNFGKANLGTKGTASVGSHESKQGFFRIKR